MYKMYFDHIQILLFPIAPLSPPQPTPNFVSISFFQYLIKFNL